MNKILLVLVILIIAFGAFAFLGNKKTSPTTKQPEPTSTEKSTSAETEQQREAINVTLADNGFTPKDIAVKAGARVVWRNSSGKAATVSSNDHPTHRLYPFLNLGEFPTSSSLQVVFDKTGKYGYHNHYNASEIGTVTVE